MWKLNHDYGPNNHICSSLNFSSFIFYQSLIHFTIHLEKNPSSLVSCYFSSVSLETARYTSISRTVPQQIIMISAGWN